MAHNGRGGHVVRIYDERLFQLLDQHATAQHAFVGEIVAEALIEYFEKRREADPSFVVGTILDHPDAPLPPPLRRAATQKVKKSTLVTAKVATAKRVPTPPPPEKIDCGF